jgi:hypothetical protein
MLLLEIMNMSSLPSDSDYVLKSAEDLSSHRIPLQIRNRIALLDSEVRISQIRVRPHPCRLHGIHLPRVGPFDPPTLQKG